MEERFRDAPFLEVSGGPYAGQVFPLHGFEVTLGRGAENDIVIKDEMVSSRHARITIRRDMVIIDDLDSTNGTIVNGVRVDSHILKPGDRILLGSTELIYRSASSAALPPPRKRDGRKWLPVLLGVALSVVLVIIGLLVALLVLRGKEKARDVNPPEVCFLAPADMTRVELPFAPGSKVDVEVLIDASDDRELHKVDLLVDGEKVTTFRAREGPPFKYTLSLSEPATYSLLARAFDAAGNEGDSGPVRVEVWMDRDRKSRMEAYVYQVDNLVLRYRQIRRDFDLNYGRGVSMGSADPGWFSLAESFYMSRESLSNLRGELATYSVPEEFRAAHINLTDMLTAAIQACNYAAEWAASNGINDAARRNCRGYVDRSDAYGNSFKSSYDHSRMEYLGMGPSPSLY